MSEVKGSGARRVYRSAVREEGARRTRSAIVEAARALFVEQGYEATSLSDIAERAGVSRPTVTTAFGAKPAVLAQVLDEALAGDDEPVAVRDRPWFQPVWQATTARDALTAYAGVCVLIAQRAAPVVEVVHRASDSAPEIEALWQSWLTGRRAGATTVVERDVVRAALRPELTVRTAGDVLWTLNDPDLYLDLVGRQRWAKARFQEWLAQSMAALILDPART